MGGMRRAVLVLPALLAGCGGGGEPAPANASNAAVELPRGPMLAGVDLSQPVRATDAALSWSLEIAPGEISFTRFSPADGDGEDQVTPFFPVSPRVAGDSATYPTKAADGTPATITLSAAPCSSDGAPDLERPLTATIRWGARTLQGCAGARPADGLDTQPNDNAAAAEAANGG
jgi:uncharacterized membrane protein